MYLFPAAQGSQDIQEQPEMPALSQHAHLDYVCNPMTHHTLAPNHTASRENERRGGIGRSHATSKRVDTIQS